MMTIHDLVQGARDRFLQAGISSTLAGLDAEVLARRVLGWDQARFLTNRHDRATSVFLLNYEPLGARRERREPVSYILGTREFYGLDFEVTPDVLSPRPETELAVAAALDVLASPGSSGRVVDVGTGSGCIAVAIAVTRRDATILAIDRSPAALAVAARNVRRHGVADRVALVAADMLTALSPRRPVDVVVSNPPYVPDHSADVAPDVARYEPASALYAGPDGLDVVRRLVAGAAPVVRPGGRLVLEIGIGQADAVVTIAATEPAWTGVTFRPDLQGIARIAVLTRATVSGR